MARVLIIDDDPTIRSLVGGIVETMGNTIVEARDGRAGVEVFSREKIDLIVTDIVMPEQEGIETIGAIRRLDRVVPILAISGSSTIGGAGDYLRAAAALGASATLQKPFAADHIIDTIDRLLARPAP